MIWNDYDMVWDNIGPDAMHYISDRITAIDGVLAWLPCRSVNEDVKYNILVQQKEYHRVRSHSKEVIPPWYKKYVAPDGSLI